jgi:hypothetical protein
MGFTHFGLKGLVKVRTEWSLVTLAYNLKRVLNLVGFQKLMAAVPERPAATPAREKPAFSIQSPQ